MKLITAEQQRKLLDNGARRMANPDVDLHPIVKWFDPYGSATWLITDMDPDDHDRVFGLCDLGLGFPELGWASVREVRSIMAFGAPRFERDMYWTAEHPISVYAQQAREEGRIVA
jgi:hypothetical protein